MSERILGLLSPGVCTLGHPLPAVAKYWVADHASCALWGGASLYGQTPQYHYIELFRAQYSFTSRDYFPAPTQSRHAAFDWTQYLMSGGLSIRFDPALPGDRLVLLSGM